MEWYLTTTVDTEHFGGKGAVVKVFVEGEYEKAVEALNKFRRRYGNIFVLSKK
jgi:hypothetical protein